MVYMTPPEAIFQPSDYSINYSGGPEIKNTQIQPKDLITTMSSIVISMEVKPLVQSDDGREANSEQKNYDAMISTFDERGPIFIQE